MAAAAATALAAERSQAPSLPRVLRVVAQRVGTPARQAHVQAQICPLCTRIRQREHASLEAVLATLTSRALAAARRGVLWLQWWLCCMPDDSQRMLGGLTPEAETLDASVNLQASQHVCMLLFLMR